MFQKRSQITIKGMGVYIPKRVLSNHDLAKIVNTSTKWISSRSGIYYRHIAAKNEYTSDMATRAAEKAIYNSGLSKNEIDLLIISTITPDMPFPSTACLVQDKLCLSQIASFDISAACSGFVYLIEIATCMLRSGRYKNALIVGSEKLSSSLDWTDRRTCVLFGDGAGSVVLSKSNKKSELSVVDCILGSDGSKSKLLYMPAGGCVLPASFSTICSGSHFLKMNGKEIFKLAIKVMCKIVIKILTKHGLNTNDIKYIIPHQANLRIIEGLSKRLEVEMNKFIVNLGKYGNTSAASIPLALNDTLMSRDINSGNYILLVTFGAGLTWAVALLQWL